MMLGHSGRREEAGSAQRDSSRRFRVAETARVTSDVAWRAWTPRAWDERYAGSELVWSAEPNQFVGAECADLPPGRAVDLAAGEGRNAIWLARRGWNVTAVDFSQVALDKGRQLAGDTAVDWVCADATTWRGEGYDLVVLAYLQLPAAERGRPPSATAFDALVPGRHVPPGRPRLDQPHRGHRRSAGPGGADDRRGRPRRPGRRGVRRGRARAVSDAWSPGADEHGARGGPDRLGLPGPAGPQPVADSLDGSAAACVGDHRVPDWPHAHGTDPRAGDPCRGPRPRGRRRGRRRLGCLLPRGGPAPCVHRLELPQAAPQGPGRQGRRRLRRRAVTRDDAAPGPATRATSSSRALRGPSSRYTRHSPAIRARPSANGAAARHTGAADGPSASGAAVAAPGPRAYAGSTIPANRSSSGTGDDTWLVTSS